MDGSKVDAIVDRLEGSFGDVLNGEASVEVSLLLRGVGQYEKNRLYCVVLDAHVCQNIQRYAASQVAIVKCRRRCSMTPSGVVEDWSIKRRALLTRISYLGSTVTLATFRGHSRYPI